MSSGVPARERPSSVTAGPMAGFVSARPSHGRSSLWPHHGACWLCPRRAPGRPSQSASLGVRFRELFAALPHRAATGDEALAQVLELAAQLPNPGLDIEGLLARWQPTIDDVVAASRSDQDAAERLAPHLASSPRARTGPPLPSPYDASSTASAMRAPWPRGWR